MNQLKFQVFLEQLEKIRDRPMTLLFPKIEYSLKKNFDCEIGFPEMLLRLPVYCFLMWATITKNNNFKNLIALKKLLCSPYSHAMLESIWNSSFSIFKIPFLQNYQLDFRHQVVNRQFSIVDGRSCI